jgi:hypothetical protein
LVALALTGVLGASAQTDWRRIGGSAVASSLAGPITGPAANVWYSQDGSLLYVRTASGRIFQTLDFENWESAADIEPPQTFAREPVRKPDSSPSARYFAMSASSPEVWGAGRQLFHSEDGKNWETLTSYGSESVVGPDIHSVAVSPNDPNQLAVANEYGVWRTMDGGLTWAGLNRFLPNLSVQRILATPSGGRAARIQTEKLGVLELAPGSAVCRRPKPRPGKSTPPKCTWTSPPLPPRAMAARCMPDRRTAASGTRWTMARTFRQRDPRGCPANGWNGFSSIR